MSVLQGTVLDFTAAAGGTAVLDDGRRVELAAGAQGELPGLARGQRVRLRVDERGIAVAAAPLTLPLP
ncbi:hypothetical protein EV189_2439 [Motilibacter rhizosphaerae]|uniref:Cold shock CspA family protein n=1 Tax=Motilibacter rhizosphaerae TaxID=598652 RepID=A0A4Q7NP35_9ACTN|nr:hypothetical protein [Motilibacter rhizosphaerae]RZS87019.1 hypothetical protein EV189_2439 [Motilibacter rhizosphaerae]